MPALGSGALAPDFSLPDTRGEAFSLSAALEAAPIALVFFKVTCPTCQLALPYLERIFQGLGSTGMMVGISQHPLRETEMFAREYGITFPILLDDPRTYAVSNGYGITNVPTVFLIAPGRRIELSSVGWARADMEELNQRLADALTLPAPHVFHPGEYVPAFKSG